MMQNYRKKMTKNKTTRFYYFFNNIGVLSGSTLYIFHSLEVLNFLD